MEFNLLALSQLRRRLVLEYLLMLFLFFLREVAGKKLVIFGNLFLTGDLLVDLCCEPAHSIFFKGLDDLRCFIICIFICSFMNGGLFDLGVKVVQ